MLKEEGRRKKEEVKNNYLLPLDFRALKKSNW